eukprot:6799187-Pyramimonas_sp.AAC.1
MLLAPGRRAHSLQTTAKASRIEGGSSSKWGPGLSTAQIRFGQLIARASHIEGGSFSTCSSRISVAR